MHSNCPYYAKCKTKWQNCRARWNFSEHSVPNLEILLVQTHLFGHMKTLILRGVTQIQASWYHLNPLSPATQLQDKYNYSCRKAVPSSMSLLQSNLRKATFGLNSIYINLCGLIISSKAFQNWHFKGQTPKTTTSLYCAFVQIRKRYPFPTASTAQPRVCLVSWAGRILALKALRTLMQSPTSTSACNSLQTPFGEQRLTFYSKSSNTGRVCLFLPTWYAHILIIFKTFFPTDKIVRKRKPVYPKKDTNQQCWEYNEKPSVWPGWISWKGMYSVSGTTFRERT